MFTSKQRKFFNAAADRGEPGMAKLRDEANLLRGEGKERPPVHKAEGGDTCYACGGKVDAHGMAHGGEVEADEAEARRIGELEDPSDPINDGVNAHGEPSQYQMAEELDDDAAVDFVRAVRRKKGMR